MQKIKNNNLVVAIYYHPEVFPPTLNAIGELSMIFDNIEVIYRPNATGDWSYPANVTTIASGEYISGNEQMKAKGLSKVSFFKKYTSDLLKSCRRNKPVCILLYDPLALLSYYLIRPLLRFEHKTWYHNHDVFEEKLIRKYSLTWYAKKVEFSFLKKLDIFTLPTDERLTYFNMNEFKGKYFCIPNYPSLQFYKQFYKEKKLNGEMRIIYQGRIGKDHGIEEIIPLLKKSVFDFKLKLILKGYCDDSYRKEIEKLAAFNEVQNSIEFYGYTSYRNVPLIASNCHVGIGIFAKRNVMNDTLGTASNKVYEYAACGLPVLYLGSSGLKKYLDEFSWAFPVELSTSSIRREIENIAADYGNYSNAAYSSFCEKLHFEYSFETVKDYVRLICNLN